MFSKLNKFTYNNKLIFLLLIFLGIFYRFYNGNLEDYWFDELFGFWISDPQLNFDQSYDRSFNIGFGQNLLFDFILKYFYLLFGYFPENGRFLTIIISCLTIPLVAILSYKIDKSKSYLLTTFLVSHCWYLISYSQEVRSYSFGYMLSVLSLIIFIDLLKNDYKKISSFYIVGFFFLVLNLLGLINHIFFGIVILAQFIFLFNYIKDKKKFNFFILNFFSLGIIYLILMYPFLIKNLSSDKFWISQVEIEFFINYFFPRFFGSKIMGYLYLFSLIFLMLKHKKLILTFKSNYQLLFILLISSYFFPLIYGLIKIPILIDRYIIFVITPIILLISIFVFKQPLKIRKILIIIICLTTFVNNYLEIFERNKTKPEFNKSLEYISRTDTKNVTLITSDKNSNYWLLNYLKKINYSKYANLNYLEENQLKNVNQVWAICYLPLNFFNCETEKIFENFQLINVKKFYLVNLIFYKKI